MKRYCIMHEDEDTVAIDGFNQAFHLIDRPYRTRIEDGVIDWSYDTCYGPFTFTAPPELEEDWELTVSEPSPAELVEMDAVASELLTEFALV